MSIVAERTLTALARLLARTELAHSEEMKAALRDVPRERQYRAHELERVKAAFELYRIPIVDRVLLDLGCNDGALPAGYAQLGARELIGVDVCRLGRSSGPRRC